MADSTRAELSAGPDATSTVCVEIIVDESLAGNVCLLLETPIAGLPLLDRHLRSSLAVGLTDIFVRIPAGRDDLARAITARGEALRIPLTVIDGCESADLPGPVRAIEWPARLLVDPRALQQAIALSRTVDRTIVFVDRCAAQYQSEEKSPYRVGAPDGRDGRLIEPLDVDGLVPIRTDDGVTIRLRAAHAQDHRVICYDVGRYYWHQVRTAADAEEAATKILLSTMKPTDGIFAKSNRRVSLRITRLLLPTPVTANAATIAVLACSILAGVVFVTGSFVAGAFLSWVASMLDGVDGEIARAKLMVSEWGHWLEMACDYAFYVAIIVGCGGGLAQVEQNAAWFHAGLVGAVGVVVAFASVAWLKRRYQRVEPDGDYYLAFQHTLDVHMHNPVHYFTRYCTFLGTRAVCPYFMVLFALLGLAKPMFIFMLAATQLTWMLSLYSSRLRFAVQPPPEARPRPLVGAPEVARATTVPGES